MLVQHEAEVKVSLRSKQQDIAFVAEHFGGGGHKNACGFTAKSGDIEEILDKILNYINVSNLEAGEEK
jgi:phosphoesterase RecJ-like protein